MFSEIIFIAQVQKMTKLPGGFQNAFGILWKGIFLVFGHHLKLYFSHGVDFCADQELGLRAFDRHKNHRRAIITGPGGDQKL